MTDERDDPLFKAVERAALSAIKGQHSEPIRNGDEGLGS